MFNAGGHDFFNITITKKIVLQIAMFRCVSNNQIINGATHCYSIGPWTAISAYQSLNE
jgi:hypothetical protein